MPQTAATPSCVTLHTPRNGILSSGTNQDLLAPSAQAAPPPLAPIPVRSPRRSARWPRLASVRATPGSSWTAAATEEHKERKRCLRCGGSYRDEENHPSACAFHGHVTGEKGLLSLSPPHQGIDGEWSDKSGIIVYRWNNEGSRPNTGRANWKRPR
ncbi:hypothetical protein ZEAMMB73_Zm00001d006014 [Zea mays]|uniref:Uncharacterized protein n=1 Tax=Zea mays TaxID=4577 RepID=A0A1D6ES29_MAIZE|nr:hypothetical protein ZEAMMB73_Zm00001d006014 [Zea mays]